VQLRFREYITLRKITWYEIYKIYVFISLQKKILTSIKIQFFKKRKKTKKYVKNIK